MNIHYNTKTLAWKCIWDGEIFYRVQDFSVTWQKKPFRTVFRLNQGFHGRLSSPWTNSGARWTAKKMNCPTHKYIQTTALFIAGQPDWWMKFVHGGLNWLIGQNIFENVFECINEFSEFNKYWWCQSRWCWRLLVVVKHHCCSQLWTKSYKRHNLLGGKFKESKWTIQIQIS